MKTVKGRPILFFENENYELQNTYFILTENIKLTVLTKKVTTGSNAEFQP
jgi:hypothetical protein